MKKYGIRSNYRKIYEQHYGIIPKDENGRCYEIHHIDGNRSNNNITNLKAVSIKEHYDIHYAQKDWGACFRISQRLKLSPKEKSFISSQCQKKRLLNGTHPWLNGEPSRQRELKKIIEGTHPFIQSGFASKREFKKVREGRHPFVGGKIQSKSNQQRLKNKTHHLLGHNYNRIRLDNGTHPSQLKWICTHCNIKGKGKGNLIRYHEDNCKKISKL